MPRKYYDLFSAGIRIIKGNLEEAFDDFQSFCRSIMTINVISNQGKDALLPLILYVSWCPLLISVAMFTSITVA